MSCPYQNICGGCQLRNLSTKDYQAHKQEAFKKTVEKINQKDIKIGDSIFIPDGRRRRATFAFQAKKASLVLGFNQEKSKDIIDIANCALLTKKINQNLSFIKELIKELSLVPITKKLKGKNTSTEYLNKDDISITETDNGLDVVLETKHELNLEHRMIISEMLGSNNDIIRFSTRKDTLSQAETIIEKTKPLINIKGISVFIPAATFLQASKEAETALIDLVLKYTKDISGNIADLFCGVGTFSYPLSQNPSNKILSIDSSKELLDGFKYSLNKNMITNIEVKLKNLFKYPLDEKELKGIDIIVIDPPRAGAENQVKHIKEAKKIIAVSCNPNTFIKDANTIISNGYKIEEITLVDQFIYSNHSELVAVFTRA